MHLSDFLGSLLTTTASATTALAGTALTGTAMTSAVLVAALLAAAPRPAGALEVGEPLPEIVLPSLDGTPMSVSSFRGKKLAVHVWASW